MRLVAIGDFNAFEFTDGYVDVMGQVTGNLDPAGALLPATDEVNPDLTNQTFNMPADRALLVRLRRQRPEPRPRGHLAGARRAGCAAPSTRAATPTRPSAFADDPTRRCARRTTTARCCSS